MTANQRSIVGRAFYVAGILVSLATFILQALPVNWGIFLSASCFIVGSLFWPGWNGIGDDSDRSAQ